MKEKKHSTEHFKRRFTYTLLCCILGVSFRGGGGGYGGWGATQNLITDFENSVLSERLLLVTFQTSF